MTAPTITAPQVKTRACLLWALTLALGTYASYIFHIFDNNIFAYFYYGNLKRLFYCEAVAAYLFVLLPVLRKRIAAQTGLNIMPVKHPPLTLGRKAVLYVMTVVPILLTAVALGYRFKIVYLLGDRIAAVMAVCNAAGALMLAAKLFVAVYAIFMVQAGVEALLGKESPIPFGGIFAALTFGTLEWLTEPSRFSLLYLGLFVYVGILALVSKRRFGVTYALSVVLYLL